MPPIPAGDMTKAQKRAARELASGPRGAVVGPFIPALRSPELLSRLQRLGEYLRYDNVLGMRLTELVILLTARAWAQQFEWTVHAATAAE
jgi:4-carboxymuconolactone decarboxylase